ncbi:hypothetical protein N9P07_04090 [Alphaproteobacteria bacterium]|nr:hypothetical protein [Alphaproteobacteria bacterium]
MELTIEEKNKAEVIIETLILARKSISYSDLASHLGLSGAQKINRIVNWLEEITWQDMKDNKPLRASMVFSKRTPGLPAPGFFNYCTKIGVFNWKMDSENARIFIKSQQLALYSLYD